jgi:galactose-1-phosphate uridylyltransferase
MEALEPKTMYDAFSASMLFLKKVSHFDPLVHFFSINWNYMPPAGSSMVHAHLQPNAGEVPTNEQRLQLEGCRKYKLETNRNFWDDYIEAEKQEGERYLAEIGPTFWSLNFVPFSFLPDVRCIFSKRRSLLQFEDDDIMCFLNGLTKTLKFFVDQKIYSFNMALFSSKEEETHRVNARICPRLLPRPIGNSDVAYPQMMYKEPFTVQPPEALCARMKEFFND